MNKSFWDGQNVHRSRRDLEFYNETGNLENDIRFSREDANLIKSKSGFKVPEELIGRVHRPSLAVELQLYPKYDEDEEISNKGAPRAAQENKRLWNNQPISDPVDQKSKYSVPYMFDKSFSSKVYRAKVRSAIEEFSRVSCIKFIEVSSTRLGIKKLYTITTIRLDLEIY